MKPFQYSVIVFVLALTSNSVLGQDQITSSVFGNGATTTSTDRFKIVGTLGQPAISVTRGTDNIIQAGFWYRATDLLTSVEPVETDPLPAEFHLEQNYPNPFNPSTTIQFAVPKASHVTLTIYDTVGRHVATLVDDAYPAGAYRVVFDAGELASGVYVYRITAGAFQATRKMLFLR